MFKRWQNRARADWLRGVNNLRPRKWDWDEHLVIWSGVSIIVWFVLLLGGVI